MRNTPFRSLPENLCPYTARRIDYYDYYTCGLAERTNPQGENPCSLIEAFYCKLYENKTKKS